MRLLFPRARLTLAEYHEQEEIFKLRLGHLKKVSVEDIHLTPVRLLRSLTFQLWGGRAGALFWNSVFTSSVCPCRRRLRSRQSWRGWSE